MGFPGAVFFGKQALTFINRPKYSTHPKILVWLMGAWGSSI
jgi:hypothetical protein